MPNGRQIKINLQSYGWLSKGFRFAHCHLLHCTYTSHANCSENMEHVSQDSRMPHKHRQWMISVWTECNSFTPAFGAVIADVECVTHKWILAAFKIFMKVLVRNLHLIPVSGSWHHHHFRKQCPVMVYPSACYIPENSLEENVGRSGAQVTLT